ncbi:MvaI/BcnI family restriction endonuclease [Sphingobacterium multivorum]|uniref:MvaI/BcnI family restriction endonuclease n=1 Tax=Sphingobacterium multivorum TaxID=28454 RepID=UPI0028A5DB06|nr:MvaI/BcnI family restriction endonuclease [Sphingobacterium multivorum]
MRQLISKEITRLTLLTQESVEVTLIEPTLTGLGKSIMDATGSVRAYLKNKGIHDFSLQGQGPSHKIIVESYLVEKDRLVRSSASLYRPNTKKGDPRIWFTGLREYTAANEILALLVFEHKIYVVNISRLDLAGLIESPADNPLKELILEISSRSRRVANELLFMLHKIAARGPIQAMLKADTAIGRTLETELGISINSSKDPDYKGIELKSFRDQRKNRKTLFAQVPDWESSKFKSSSQILDNFGYWREEDFKLYCTVSAIVRNSQGLGLRLDSDLRQLVEHSDRTNIGDFVVWGLETLHKRLLEKHNETFWIAADSIIIDGNEHFLYRKVEHTKKPVVSQFDILLEQGIITLDHLIKRNSKGRVVEKGPLFKIKPNGINLLFPQSQIYDLI